MENSLEKVQKQVDSLNSKKELLIQSLGRENFESIVDEVNKVIFLYNLSTTPTILKDLMDYVVNATFTTALEVPVQEQPKEISKNELLVLLITIESLLSKSIQMLRSSKPFYESTT